MLTVEKGLPRLKKKKNSLSMGFSRQEYWSGLPFPPSGDLHNPGIEPVSLKSPALTGYFFFFLTWEAPSQQLTCIILTQNSLVSRSQQETKGVLELGS